MTRQVPPDLLDLAEVVAGGALRMDEAERQVRAALGAEPHDGSENTIRELRQLIAAASAVRSHVRATREASTAESPELVHPTASMATIVPGHVGAGAVRRPARTREGRRPRRTWLLVAAAAVVLAVGALSVSRPTQPAVGGQSPTLGVSASPSAVASPTGVPARAASWTATGSMIQERHGQTATLLPDGTVLVAGGYDANDHAVASAELYGTATGTFSPTGAMTTARAFHTATLLINGTVLVAGGDVRGTSELYDPAHGTWTATGSMGTPRAGHTATLLRDGTVLVTGGTRGSGQGLASAELYDPASGSWTATGDMAEARNFHTATMLADGKVLVAGGGPVELASAELFDPGTRTWSATGSMAAPRWGHTATLLRDGRVLVAGNDLYDGPMAELYDPATGSWTVAGTMSTWREGHTATLLLNGRVLVALGYGGGQLNTAELYDPATGSWTPTESMVRTPPSPAFGGFMVGRATATLLPDGKVLVAGGDFSRSAELYDPGSGTP